MFDRLFVAIILLLPQVLEAQPDWKEVGQLKTRDAKTIKASTWSIGAETLDRDYTDYQSYKMYLGPLGAKRIRLQGGWSKTGSSYTFTNVPMPDYPIMIADKGVLFL